MTGVRIGITREDAPKRDRAKTNEKNRCINDNVVFRKKPPKSFFFILTTLPGATVRNRM